jgi:hypothetical protein
MKKSYIYSLIIWLPALIIVAVVSCNQPANKNNKEINDTELSGNLTANEEQNIHLDSVISIANNNTRGDNYEVNCEESIINWYCVTHTGYVKLKEGTVLVADGNIVNGNFTICMDSIEDVDIDYQLMKEVLVNTLKSADFFDINKYPLGYFDLVRVTKTSNESFEVVGNLTIKDVTRQVRFNSSIQINDSLILVESERFQINRTKWGLTLYSGNFEQTDKSFLFTDFVEIQISLQLQKSPAKSK